MKSKTTCKEKCCFQCVKQPDCQHKCGEATDKDCVGVPYNDCPNYEKSEEKI